jgi:hypothetical protein
LSTFLLTVVTLIYLGVSIDNIVAGKQAWSLVFFSYALANVGLILADK